MSEAADRDHEASGVLVTDAKGVVVAADEGLCDILGLEVDEIVGAAPPYPWWAQESVPWFLAQLGPRLRSGPRRRLFEGEWVRTDGRRVHVMGRATAVSGGEASVAFVVQDVTAVTDAEDPPDTPPVPDSTPELEAWLGRMFRSNIVGIIAGQGDRVVEANDAFLQMLGYTRREFVQGGINWAAITPPEWFEADARAGEVMLREGASPTIEKEYFRKDGSRVRVQIAGAVVSRRPFRWISVVQDQTAEREYRDAIRRAVVPPELPQPAGLSVHARYFAADGFTGDFYDLFPLPGDAGWGLVLGDVSGHGHPAAGLTALARHALRGAALAEPRPAQALTILNQAILDAGVEPAYCTVVFAQLKTEERGVVRARIARAGHPYPLVVRSSGAVERVEPDGLPLGLFPAAAPCEHRVLLGPRDVLVFYTDGLTDTRPDEPPFPTEKLEQVAAEAAGASPRAVAEAILDHVHDRLSQPLTDDVAVITLGRNES